MGNVPEGLAALQQADSALATAVSGAISEINALSGQLLNSEDPAVAAIAKQINDQAVALNAAVTAAQTPATPPATGGSTT